MNQEDLLQRMEAVGHVLVRTERVLAQTVADDVLTKEQKQGILKDIRWCLPLLAEASESLDPSLKAVAAKKQEQESQ